MGFLSKASSLILGKVYKFLEIEARYPENLKAKEVGSYTELSAQTRAQLEDYFKPHNQDLVELLGDEFQW